MLRLSCGRWALILAYSLATIAAHCAHDHEPRAYYATGGPHTQGGDSHLRSAGDTERGIGSADDRCAACRFLGDNQAQLPATSDAARLSVGDTSIPFPPQVRPALVIRRSCRAPPAA
ncbi:MAG: hypothetical protein KatS3mg108_0711 [Isosphaeraceae bacterium]|nr:MAG: hypothetical protein KatS3mg108_0711 [Isosphaeraceae bacterium]